MLYLPIHLPSKSTIHVGKYTIVPWMVWGIGKSQNLGAFSSSRQPYKKKDQNAIIHMNNTGEIDLDH